MREPKKQDWSTPVQFDLKWAKSTTSTSDIDNANAFTRYVLQSSEIVNENHFFWIICGKEELSDRNRVLFEAEKPNEYGFSLKCNDTCICIDRTNTTPFCMF